MTTGSGWATSQTLRTLPSGVDAVVSLCRVPESDVPDGVEQIDVRLIDDVGSDDNANLDFVLTDTTRLIEQLRREGRTVFLHCVAAQSRTPTVAALYGARLRNISADEALREITAVLPRAYPNSAFRAALQRLAAGPDPGILSRQAARSRSCIPASEGQATDD